MTIFTANVGSVLNIVETDKIFRASVKANGGTVLISGTVPAFKGIVATPVTLLSGQALVLEAWPMAGLTFTITPGTGTADIILCYG